MRILITGVCGFVGSTLAKNLAESGAGHTLIGLDNFIRPGSETNRAELRRATIVFRDDRVAAIEAESLPAKEDPTDPALPGYRPPSTAQKAQP